MASTPSPTTNKRALTVMAATDENQLKLSSPEKQRRLSLDMPPPRTEYCSEKTLKSLPSIYAVLKEEEEEEGEEVEVFVQVGILSGGEVISTKYAAGTLGHFRGYLDNPDEAFRDEAQAALLPAYTEWLRKHLETDACLLESHLSVDDLFLDISQVQSEKLD